MHIGYTCAICRNIKYGVVGQEYYENEDLNVLNFERIKWGGVRHGKLLYTLFDLEQFMKEKIPEPTSEDAEISLLKANKAERDVIIEILACIVCWHLNPMIDQKRENMIGLMQPIGVEKMVMIVF